MNDQQLDCALDLMRRLPPQQIEKNLSDLIDLVPSLCEDLLSSVDQPLKIARDKVVGKDYLLCDYNRDGDSYRSPWSNKYEPPIEDGAMPSARLRKLEVEANNAFDQYRDLYFEGGVSSVYLWDLDHGFAGVILIKKAGDGSKKIKGCWDSIHVVEVQEKSSGRTAHYKLTSTVMLWLQTTKTGSGTMNLGGSLTRQMEKDETVGESSPHIANIGRLVEDMENKIRSTLNEIYFGKTKDIVNGLRYCYRSCLNDRIIFSFFYSTSKQPLSSDCISLTQSVYLLTCSSQTFSCLFCVSFCHLFEILFSPIFAALLFSCFFCLFSPTPLPPHALSSTLLPFVPHFCCHSYQCLSSF
uniref:F-actin-capping protein subunit beta n=1 Tax=Amphiprion percula TaxID=161767 RepID=A0A3P8T7R6_AMPPE